MVARGGSVDDAALGAEDDTVRFKQTAMNKLQELHASLLDQVIRDAGRRNDRALVDQLTAERERGMLFLMGGDEITISLHPALEAHLGAFAAQLARRNVANARVAVMRTGEGSQEGDSKTSGSLKHAMNATVGLKTLKGYEEDQRQLEEGLERVLHSEYRREGRAMIVALRLDELYVDVEVDGSTERQVVKRFPGGEPVPADLKEQIARVKKWLEDHRE